MVTQRNPIQSLTVLITLPFPLQLSFLVCLVPKPLSFAEGSGLRA